jgi:hypothetical protein
MNRSPRRHAELNCVMDNPRIKNVVTNVALLNIIYSARRGKQ